MNIRPPEFLALNPYGKVPWVENGLISESDRSRSYQLAMWRPAPVKLTTLCEASADSLSRSATKRVGATVRRTITTSLWVGHAVPNRALVAL